MAWGDKNDRNVPTRVEFDQMAILEIVSAGNDHTVALGIEDGTFKPTPEPVAPTVSPVFVATPYPTMSAKDGQDLFLWGAPKAMGRDINDNVLQPLYVDEDAVWVSAGSAYSLVALADGTALSAGPINSMNDYRGHLGLEKGR